MAKKTTAKKTTAKKGEQPAQKTSRRRSRASRKSARPRCPIDKLLSEARTLVVAAKRDAARLAKVGKKASLIALVAALATMVSAVQLKILAARRVGRTKSEIATDMAAREYRQRALEDLEFATEGAEDSAARISAIREGEGVDDLIADLAVIVAFILEIPEKLAAIGQNPTKLANEGQKLETQLSSLVDERRTASDETSLTTERDRGATALSAAMATLRSGGKYAFRDEPEKARLYMSTYTRVRKAVYRAKQTKAKKAASKKTGESSAS